MPNIVFDIIEIVASLIRIAGMVLLGLGFGWFTLEVFRKAQFWALQAVAFLGLSGLVIAIVAFTETGAMGAFAIGVGAALLLWGRGGNAKTTSDEE